MAKNRMINTRFWSDSYISGIDPLEKLLFLYFITNQYTNICGIYEIPLKQIALDTGIDKENLEKVFLPRLQNAGKIYYFNGWVFIKNFLKHQKSSGNVQLGIENGMQEVPSEIIAKIKAIKDTPPSHIRHSLKLKPKLELESELELKLEPTSKPDGLQDEVNQIMDIFYKINPSLNYGNRTQREAVNWGLKKWGLNEMLRMVEYAVSIQGRDYAPVITTPLEFKNKIAKVKIFKDQKDKPVLTIIG
jgi:hypothetical protein